MPHKVNLDSAERVAERIEQLQNRVQRLIRHASNHTGVRITCYTDGEIAVQVYVAGNVHYPTLTLVKNRRDKRGIQRFREFTGQQLIDWINAHPKTRRLDKIMVALVGEGEAT